LITDPSGPRFPRKCLPVGYAKIASFKIGF
jgi:hypothetical protein